MKIVKLVLLLMFPVICLVAEDTEKGTLETYDGKKIVLYGFPLGGKVESGLKRGCDCKLDRTKFGYYDEEGKEQKIRQSEVKQVTLERGTRLCKSAGGRGSFNTIVVMKFDLVERLELLGLPISKNGKSSVIHIPIASNDDYMLTSVLNGSRGSSGSNGAYLYLFKNGENKFIQGGMDLTVVGIGSRGKKMYKNIMKYFQDCDKLMKHIKKAEKYNNKVKRYEKVPLLDGVFNFEC